MTPFIEFGCMLGRTAGQSTWSDSSTDSEYIFESDFGGLCLRRRTAYPQTFAFIEGPQLVCGYGSPAIGGSIARQDLQGVPAEDFFGNEFLYIAIDIQQQQITIQRDALGTLPLFAGTRSGMLVVSNQFGRVASLVKKDAAVDFLAVVRHFGGASQNSFTIVRDIYAIQERVRFAWSVGGTVLHQPPDNPFLADSYSNRPGNPRHFVRNLESTIDEYAQRYFGDGPVACELSGGFDSSLIAGYLADSGRDVLAVTKQYPGAFGVSQGRKLADFKKRFATKHHVIPMDPSRHAPLADHVAAGFKEPHYPREELYTQLVKDMLVPLRQASSPAIMCGVGGDELCQQAPPDFLVGFETDLIKSELSAPEFGFLTPQFRSAAADILRKQPHQHETLPLVAKSVATGQASGNNYYIEAGIWPVSPLADPQLFNYCQGLPARYRHNKAIVKQYLKARRFPASIYEPDKEQQEHYGDFFSQAMVASYAPVLEAYAKTSVLSEWGFLHADQLRKQFYQAATLNTVGTNEIPALFAVFSVLMTDINFQILGVKTFE